jgi:Integrase core domain
LIWQQSKRSCPTGRPLTAHPTAEWVARQITEAFPWDESPHHLIRDGDRIYGSVVTRRLCVMGIRDKPTAPASPWQNGFVERLIGSTRRECVDHIIVLGEMHLRRILKSYADYYNGVRTHRSLNKDAPVTRQIQRIGSIKSHAVLGGPARKALPGQLKRVTGDKICKGKRRQGKARFRLFRGSVAWCRPGAFFE